jgi:hypothetical protein
MTEERSYRCPSCRGVVSVPSNRRRVDIEAVRAAHETSCPSRGVVIKEETDAQEAH